MFEERKRLLTVCLASLEGKGLNDSRYKDRLKRELKEIDAQAEHKYLMDLYDKFRSEKLIFPVNENNSLVDYLLGLTNEFDINSEPAWIQGECPDIDVDYLKEVRDYLKRDWAPKHFGRDKICEIGTYGTLGIKSAILDMAKVHGVDKSEIQAITVRMDDKDDDGKQLEWDKALELYPDFKSYCERFPEVSEAARLLLDRNKTAGVHAGGLIISDRALDGFVPLEVRMVNKQNPNGVICSAWTEGLNAQDLQPVGLIKFDLLVINNLMQIALACKLVKERHGLKSICALDDGWDWSDILYLNDEKSLEMANRADLKCIFQFDSEGIRKLVKKGGVSSFDDLAAYSALYRPGPLNMGMDARYCKRKKWKEGDREHGEPYSLHPLIEPILGRTYGVMIFQEQVMDMLRVIGNIPDMHTEKVRKAISKKKVEQFIKYKEMFVKNGKVNLGVNEDYVVDLWKQIESFAEYGFNASHAYAYTYISARLLWLKAHYPLEFYAAILMCEQDEDKFKEYKLDAKYHGVDVHPVDVNKSKVNFHIEGNEIYFGFKNIKGIGSAVAERIVQGQPYKNFVAFLDQFGTDASTVKALISLGCFRDEKHDRLTLRKFHEFYKDQIRKRRERQKRFEVSMENRSKEVEELLLTEITTSDPDWEVMNAFTEDAQLKWTERFWDVQREVSFKVRGETRIKQTSLLLQLLEVAKKRETSIANFEGKERESDCRVLSIEQFDPCSIRLDEEEESVLIDEMVVNGNTTFPQAESLYYGFQWTHILETSPDYTGLTIDKFLDEADSKGCTQGLIEIMVRGVQKRTSKGQKKIDFWSVTVEDANAKQMVINVWSDAYHQWKDELKKGNLLRVQVNPPSGGFNTMTLPSYGRRNVMPTKEEDGRVFVMRPGEKLETPQTEDFTFDASAIDGLSL